MKLLSTTLLLSILTLTACENTWRGAGADIERMGQNMQKPMAQDPQPSNNQRSVTVYPL